MLSFTKTFEFSASHTLLNPKWDQKENLERFGKCANPAGHGHNYTLEVTVSGELNPDTSMLIEACELQALVDREIINHLDHRNLNTDVNWLKDKNPTTEVLVLEIASRIKNPIQQKAPNCYLKKIILRETRKIFATWEAD